MPTARTENLDHTLVALADPTRRAILRRLARGEARITDLAEPFSISFNSVSKHIKLLERAALIERRKVGREYILQFRPRPLNDVQAWISKQQAFWQAGLAAIDDMLRDEDSNKGKDQR